MKNVKSFVCSSCGRSFIAINFTVFHIEKGELQISGDQFVSPFVFYDLCLPKQQAAILQLERVSDSRKV